MLEIQLFGRDDVSQANADILQALDTYGTLKNPSSKAEFTKVMEAAMSCKEEYAVIKSNEEAVVRLEMLYFWARENGMLEEKLASLLEECHDKYQNCIKQAHRRFEESSKLLRANALYGILTIFS